MASEIDYVKVGERIQEARKHSRKMQYEVAKACGCDPKHMSAVENGRTHPSLDLLMKLSNELDVSVDYFLKDSPLAYPGYCIDVECAERLRRMSAENRIAILKIMDAILEAQGSFSEK
ncbi:MAG: helix-turn-helix domain-containing protein [Fusicatenibacter sp.]